MNWEPVKEAWDVYTTGEKWTLVLMWLTIPIAIVVVVWLG